MLSRDRRDRALPTFVTLLVIGLLLMTFDVRLEGGGVVGSLRSGTQTLLAPVQKAAATVVNPVGDLIDSLSNVASLREENQILEAELAAAIAALVAVQDDLARLDVLEQLYSLDIGEASIGRTEANVIGRPDAFDQGFIIDKGTRDGVLPGQPVIDVNGYVVGRVKDASPATATVVPINVSRAGIAVLVGAQIGSLTPQPLTSDMRLDIREAREPILGGDRVVTSSASAAYPAGLAIGEVIEDAAPQNGSLTAEVRPFVEPGALRVVVVLAWPPDPIATVTDEPEVSTSTAPGSSTTGAGDASSTTGGEGQ
jgi:rod shape-determining protein MreC